MDLGHKRIQEAIAAKLVLVVVDGMHQIDVLQLFDSDEATGDVGLAQVLDAVIKDGSASLHENAYQTFQLCKLLVPGGAAGDSGRCCAVFLGSLSVQLPLNDCEDTAHQGRTYTAAQDC